MAFLLVVNVAGEQLAGNMMFRDINRCNYFAYRIEHNEKGKKQLDIAAYCIPKMVSTKTTFWD